MLTAEKISQIKSSNTELLLFALKKECIKGEDASFYWNLTSGIKNLLEIAEVTPDLFGLEDKLDCLVSMIPPHCQPIPVYVDSDNCGMTVDLDVICSDTGNPCANFNITLSVY